MPCRTIRAITTRLAGTAAATASHLVWRGWPTTPVARQERPKRETQNCGEADDSDVSHVGVGRMIAAQRNVGIQPQQRAFSRRRRHANRERSYRLFRGGNSSMWPCGRGDVANAARARSATSRQAPGQRSHAHDQRKAEENHLGPGCHARLDEDRADQQHDGRPAGDQP